MTILQLLNLKKKRLWSHSRVLQLFFYDYWKNFWLSSAFEEIRTNCSGRSGHGPVFSWKRSWVKERCEASDALRASSLARGKNISTFCAVNPLRPRSSEGTRCQERFSNSPWITSVCTADCKAPFKTLRLGEERVLTKMIRCYFMSGKRKRRD